MKTNQLSAGYSRQSNQQNFLCLGDAGGLLPHLYFILLLIEFNLSSVTLLAKLNM
jgi:hypothetical protein